MSVRVIFVGTAGVGKTSIVHYYMTGRFSRHTPTLGFAYSSRVVEVGYHTVNMQIWNTGGQERFRSMLPMYCRNGQVGIVVFSIVNQ
jgi:small GTP-binding protein